MIISKRSTYHRRDPSREIKFGSAVDMPALQHTLKQTCEIILYLLLYQTEKDIMPLSLQMAVYRGLAEAFRFPPRRAYRVSYPPSNRNVSGIQTAAAAVGAIQLQICVWVVYGISPAAAIHQLGSVDRVWQI